MLTRPSITNSKVTFLSSKAAGEGVVLLPRLEGESHVQSLAQNRVESRVPGTNLDAQAPLPFSNQRLPSERSKPDKLKIVLVDDQVLFRRGLSELLTHCYDLDVLGAVGSIEELRALLDEQPDLLVMDLRMKPMDGLSMMDQLRKEGYATPVVMLTMSDSEVDLANALRVGVRGYLLKDMAPDEVVDAIRRVAAGELVIAPPMTVKMIGMLRGDHGSQVPKSMLNLLTEREREILQLLSKGESNKSIAVALQISYDTVKQHVSHILQKLNLHSRVNAAILFVSEQDKLNNNNSGQSS